MQLLSTVLNWSFSRGEGVKDSRGGPDISADFVHSRPGLAGLPWPCIWALHTLSVRLHCAKLGPVPRRFLLWGRCCSTRSLLGAVVRRGFGCSEISGSHFFFGNRGLLGGRREKTSASNNMTEAVEMNVSLSVCTSSEFARFERSRRLSESHPVWIHWGCK